MMMSEEADSKFPGIKFGMWPESSCPTYDGIERTTFTNWKAVPGGPSKPLSLDLLDTAAWTNVERGRGDRPDLTVVSPKQYARAQRGECIYCGVTADSDEHRGSICYANQVRALERCFSIDAWFEDRGL